MACAMATTRLGIPDYDARQMRLSRRSEYGLRALVDLVRHEGSGPIALASLAQRNQLPQKFLEQIMATLKHGGIVRTTLGAHGGYAMAADPSTVSIGRVVRLLDGALAPLPCVSLRYYGHCSCPDEATCPLRDVMIDVRDAMLEILDTETLRDLAARQGQVSIDPRGRHADALAGRRP
jgi:Rrf2 family protein